MHTALADRRRVSISIEDSLNFRRINERVTTSGVVVEEALGSLRADGYDVVINLLPDDSDYAVKGEADLVTGQELVYVYIPVDWAVPTNADFDAFAAAMDTNEGRTVHVHCAANYRVSAFYALYALQKGLWSAAEADEHIGTIWNPPEYPVWEAFVAEQRQRKTP